MKVSRAAAALAGKFRSSSPASGSATPGAGGEGIPADSSATSEL